MTDIALIGCGNMGGAHRGAAEALEGRFRFAAAVDIDRPRAEEAAKVLGCDVAETDYRKVLDRVDAALIVLPHHLHHSVGMECLQAGKHVLMEKPLAVSEQECLDLIDAAEDRNRVLMVAYCMRYQPLMMELERLIKEKTYGEVFQVSIWTEQMTRRPEADSWVHQRRYVGGGQLFSHGCHYIDLLLSWLGDPVEGVHLGTNLGTPWLDFEGTSNVSIRFSSGALGYHMGTWGARGTRHKYSFHVHCTEGMLEVHLHSGTLILHRDAEEDASGREQVLMEADHNKAVGAEMAHFLDCIESGSPPLTGGRESLQGLRVIWRLYEAEERSEIADLRGLGLNAK